MNSERGGNEMAFARNGGDKKRQVYNNPYNGKAACKPGFKIKRLIKFHLLYVLLVVSLFSCEKNSYQQSSPAGNTQLLTAKPWKLLSYGYDHNGDGIINPGEESIRDCEKDNVSVFKNDGSGLVMENEVVCGGNEKVSQFSWVLADNDTVIDFTTGAAFITELSAYKFIIRDTISNPVRLIVTYGH